MDVGALLDTNVYSHIHTHAHAHDDTHDDTSSSSSSSSSAKSFLCSWDDCDRSFARKSDLVRHFRIHTGVKPFECPWDDCDKRFIQRSALKVHFRTHSGERPHTCEACDRSFSDSSSLARHRRTHTGVRPYGCDHPGCAKRFTRKTSLRKHSLTHSAEYSKARRCRNAAALTEAEAEAEDDDSSANSIASSATASPMLAHAMLRASASPGPSLGHSQASSPLLSVGYLTSAAPSFSYPSAQYQHSHRFYGQQDQQQQFSLKQALSTMPMSMLRDGSNSPSTACNSPNMHGMEGTSLPSISALLH